MKQKRQIGLIALAFVAIGFLVWLSRDKFGTYQGATGSQIVPVSLPETLSSIAQEGKLVFEAHCAVCHGKNAAGQKAVAPPLIHKIYEPSHHGDRSFFRAVQKGARSHHWSFGDMPAVKAVSGDEIRKIVIYIRELQRANNIN